MSFTRACALAEVAVDSSLAVNVDGVDVAVVRAGEDVFAIRDECSHAAVPLSEGDVEGCEIECWLHGSRFDLRTGKPSGPPATEPVPTYPVRVEGDDVLVDVSSPLVSE
ncbi:non-heme iron oxygenase ferredoxin subunit [Nocardioides mesophilus]|uniref:Non-heme iron oxygenase ferredoxin subunit n=1 Tax=Nocardioides mesophilus TaxID=433659 RepID=A0A7G9RBB6_9ACTN|nr:non-heme iron oxygenase ferredoxin subunit [Nocardioides mesophilus]QNN52891.1 non-heme iron oxygenase ferredoxin subunit [Nocardioides mesophilus]